MLSRSSTEQSIRTCIVSSIPSLDPQKIRSIVHVPKSRYVMPVELWNSINKRGLSYFRCAFVNFTDRESAETAVQAWASGIDVDGELITIKWGRGKGISAAKTLPPTSAEVTVASWYICLCSRFYRYFFVCIAILFTVWCIIWKRRKLIVCEILLRSDIWFQVGTYATE